MVSLFVNPNFFSEFLCQTSGFPEAVNHSDNYNASKHIFQSKNRTAVIACIVCSLYTYISDYVYVINGYVAGDRSVLFHIKIHDI